MRHSDLNPVDPARPKRAAIVISNAAVSTSTGWPVGFWWSELTHPYYILGEVSRAGEYPFTSGLTVFNAIAAAGDFTYRADKNKIMITSADGVEREVVLTSTTPVNPGDRIRIKERFF